MLRRNYFTFFYIQLEYNIDMCPSHSSCRGNVLFLILIAVALFAALSYAVTQSTRGGGGNASEEKTLLSAARLINYGSMMQATIDRMRISQGMDVTEMYVENDGTKWWDDTSRYCCLNTIPDPRRGLFHPDGGGLILQSFEDLGTPFSGGTKFGHSTYVWGRVPNIGTDDQADLLLWTVGLRRDACEAINKKVGITGVPEIDFHESDFSTGGALPLLGPATGAGVADIDGKPEVCFEYPDGRLFYSRVIKEN